MTPENCYAFDSCDSPLCPLDEDIKHRCWYSEDSICGRQFKREGEKTPLFVENQRKISRKIRESGEDTYFTFEMLNRKFIIARGIVGLNPDSEIDEKEQLKSWLKRHPLKREYSDAEKKAVGERLKKFQFQKGAKRTQKTS